MQAGQAPSSKNAIQSRELRITSLSPPLATFHLQSSQWGMLKMFKGAKVIGVIFQNRIGKQIHTLDSINMEWECDRAFFVRRKDPAGYPLERKDDGTQRSPTCEWVGGYRQDSASFYRSV